MENVSFITAFVFGIFSFISPCVLPIVPGYLSFISGLSFEELKTAETLSSARRRVVINSILFVAGFSFVFIAMGASASALGKFLLNQLPLLTKVAGVVIIIFGVHMTGIFKISFLNYEKRVHVSTRPISFLGSFIVGIAFATGWTPCIGPILASILTLAARQETLAQGVLLLSFYSAGLGIPFILAGVSITAFYKVFEKFKIHLPKIEFVSGILLIAFGILIFTNYLSALASILIEWFPFLGEVG